VSYSKLFFFSIPFGCLTKVLILYNGQQTLHRKLEIEHMMFSIKYNATLLIVIYQISASSVKNHLEFPINWRSHQLYSLTKYNFCQVQIPHNLWLMVKKTLKMSVHHTAALDLSATKHFLMDRKSHTTLLMIN